MIGHARACMVMPSSLRALLAAAAVAASPEGSNSNCANHSAGCWLHLAGKNCTAERDCGAQLVCLRGRCQQCTADSECNESERRHEPASHLGCTRQRSCASALAATAAAAAAVTAKPSLHTSSVSAAPVPEQVCRQSDAYHICAHKDMWPMDGRDGAGLAVAFVTTALTAGGSVGGNPSPSPSPSRSRSPNPNPSPSPSPNPNPKAATGYSRRCSSSCSLSPRTTPRTSLAPRHSAARSRTWRSTCAGVTRAACGEASGRSSRTRWHL